jgi:sulfonate transport system substrate-binding protein
MLRTSFAGLLAALAVAVGLALPASSSAAVDLHGITLRVGGQTDGLKSLLGASGVLSGKQYKIQWATFSSGPPLMEALHANQIDLGGVGNTPPIFAAAVRPNFRIVAGLQQYSTQGIKIVSPQGSSLRTLAQLKGKRVAYTRGTISHSYLIQALSRVHLTFKDITPVDVQPNDALAAFRGGQVDAWVAVEPFFTFAGNTTQVIPSGTGYAAQGLNVIAASTQVLGDVRKRTAVRDYLVRLQRGLAWGIAHPKEWAKAFSSETGLPAALSAQIGDAARRVKLIPARANVVTSLQRLANVLAAAKVVKHVNVAAITSNQLAH